MRSWGALAVVAMLAVTPGCASAGQDPSAWAGEPAALPGSSGHTGLTEVTVTGYGSGQPHTPMPVTYAETPPMGGPHHVLPLVCGTYEEPVPAEHAVHSLEHGVVWVTYDPGVVDEAGVRSLERLLPEKAILSPHADLPTPVVVTAWDHQLALTGHRDRGLVDFLAEYGDGHTSPEPRVPCDYGVTPGQAGSGTSV